MLDEEQELEQIDAPVDENQAVFENNDEHDDEEFEPVRLSFRQWLYVSLAILGSFVFFLILLFPIDDVVRFVVYKNFKGIEFQDLSISTFGKDKLENLVVKVGDLDIRSEKIESGLGWFSLMSKTAKGPLWISKTEIDNPVIAITAEKIKMDLDIGPLQANSATKLSGFIKISMNKVIINRAGILPLEPGLLEIADATIHTTMSNGEVIFNEFKINANAFRIELKNGKLGSSSNLATAPLSGELCLTPTTQLRENEKFISLRSLYEMIGGKLNDRFCNRLNGTLGKPGLDIQMPSMIDQSVEDDTGSQNQKSTENLTEQPKPVQTKPDDIQTEESEGTEGNDE